MLAKFKMKKCCNFLLFASGKKVIFSVKNSSALNYLLSLLQALYVCGFSVF